MRSTAGVCITPICSPERAGVGKTTLSRIFAKALNCETGCDGDPVRRMPRMSRDRRGAFRRLCRDGRGEQSRRRRNGPPLLERAVYAPVDARFKVYMIDEVHMLTNHAFNAMLKTLEEPPVARQIHSGDHRSAKDSCHGAVALLAVQSEADAGRAYRVAPRSDSRRRAHSVRSAGAALLARAADGSMSDALVVTDQAIAYSANQVTEERYAACWARSIRAI